MSDPNYHPSAEYEIHDPQSNPEDEDEANLAELDQELENDEDDEVEDEVEDLDQLMEQMDQNFEEFSTQTVSQKVLPSGAMPTSQNGKLSEHAAEFWFPECRECQCCKGFKHGCNCVKQDSFIACQHGTCNIDPAHLGQKVTASPRRPPSSSPRSMQRSNSGGSSRGPNVCKFESMPGGCRFGSNCRFQHVMNGGRGGRSGGQSQFSVMRQSSDPGPSLGGGQRPYSLPSAPHAGYGMNMQYGAPGGGSGLPIDMYGIPPPPPQGGDPRVHGYPSPQHSPHHLQYPSGPPHSGQAIMHPGGPGMMGGMPLPHQMQPMPVQQHPRAQHMSIAPPPPGAYPPQSPTGAGPSRSVSEGAKSDQMCSFFVSGQCRFGANCRNRHN